ncbi:MAG: porin [Pseudomonadota bacterium]|nr:porin [Pseudomonadota bacterium]
MRIKRLALATAVLAAVSATAQADDATVTLYGVFDVAVGSLQHSLNGNDQFPGSVDPFDAVRTTVPGSMVGMMAGGISDSRWGIRGSETISPGVKAFFTIESGINLPTGTINNAAGALGNNAIYGSSEAAASSLSGQLFNRQAFVGLSDDSLGSLQFGRNYVHMFDVYTSYDPVQDAQLFSPFGFSGTYGGGSGATESMRSDNSLKYNNRLGNFNFGGLYHFGNYANGASKGRGFDINVGYEGETFGVQAVFAQYNDVMHAGTSQGVANAGTTASPGILGTNAACLGATLGCFNSVALTEQNDRGWLLAGKYKLTSAATLKAGWQWFQQGAASDPMTVQQYGDYYGLQVATIGQIKGPAKETSIPYVGGDYNFTDRLNLAAGYYDIITKNNGANQSGEQRYYSMLLDYHLSKRTDVYVGDMYSSFSGQIFPAASFYQSNNVLAAGMRHKF